MATLLLLQSNSLSATFPYVHLAVFVGIAVVAGIAESAGQAVFAGIALFARLWHLNVITSRYIFLIYYYQPYILNLESTLKISPT